MDRTELILAKLRKRRAKAAEVGESPSENLEVEPQPAVKPKRTTAAPDQNSVTGELEQPVKPEEAPTQNAEQKAEDNSKAVQDGVDSEKKLIDNIKSIIGEDGLSNYLNSRKDLENLCTENGIPSDNLSKQAIIAAIDAKGEEFLPEKRDFLTKLDSIYNIIDGYFNIVKSELKMPELTEPKLYELIKKSSNSEATDSNTKEEQTIEVTDDGDEIPKKGDDPYNGIQEKETLETIQDDFYNQIVSIAASYYIHKKEEENNTSILHAPNLDDERRALE